MKEGKVTNWEDLFAQYDMTNVAEYNRPDFDEDDGVVLKAKLENFDRIGVPKKKKEEKGE